MQHSSSYPLHYTNPSRAHPPSYYPSPAAAATTWNPAPAPTQTTRHGYIPTPASYASESQWFEAPQYVGGRQSGYSGYSNAAAAAAASSSNQQRPQPMPPAILPNISGSYPYSRPRAQSRATPASSSSSSSVYGTPTPYLPTSPLSSAPASPPLPHSPNTGRLISSARPAPSPFLHIKQEQPDDDGFIVDAPSVPGAGPSASALAHALACAPPTEVPLRATQASERMQKGMHGHGAGTAKSDCTWAGGEARPLDEPPRIFEFQLALDHPLMPECAADDEGFGAVGSGSGGRLEDVHSPLQMKDELDFGALGAEGYAVSMDGLRAFSPEFGLESTDGQSDPSWELGYASTFDAASAYPRSLHHQQSYSNSRVHHPRRGYEPAGRRWSLPGHAHDPAGFLV
ncbi:hypothetical protein MKEN_00452600 [Mycena kentingensis (nom. inval.)]|nr:hypothetical protein MKEN_00452600 [Mycena kentingensis (nom. inval.)]